jgi:hypothetical protein
MTCAVSRYRGGIDGTVAERRAATQREGAVTERMPFWATEKSWTHPGSRQQITHFEIPQDVKEHLVREI